MKKFKKDAIRNMKPVIKSVITGKFQFNIIQFILTSLWFNEIYIQN
ncbi:MAG: hypothetical protein BAJALOKI1v1_240009 [Promethearchaeota archaeon]|nr:MAG: hypothetical protein BAJALOKI1v1_240009 [Candidatus Lokiarchaeota archaeon]